MRSNEGGYLAIPLSEDHKPALPPEQERILAAGGSVRIVEGTSIYEIGAPGTELRLRMSRSLGDFYLKNVEGVDLNHQPVIAVPDIVFMARDNQQAFVILACDGVWDVMTNQQAVELIAKLLYEDKQSPAQACDGLLAECLERKSEDNMSAIVIKLNRIVIDDIADTPVNLNNISSISSVMRSETPNITEYNLQPDSVDSCRKNLTLEFE